MYSLLLTFQWPELRHQAASNCKGGWEINPPGWPGGQRQFGESLANVSHKNKQTNSINPIFQWGESDPVTVYKVQQWQQGKERLLGPLPEDLSNPRTEPKTLVSPTWQVVSLPLAPPICMNLSPPSHFHSLLLEDETSFSGCSLILGVSTKPITKEMLIEETWIKRR